MGDLDAARYISLTTFKKDGSPVATPVWITGADGTYAFSTGGTSWKARRLADNPAVRVQVCDMRGRVAAGAATYDGSGAVATAPEDVAAVQRALSAKYGWQFRAIGLVDRLKVRLGRGEPQDTVAVHLSLHEA
jgi:PPOX class probable F420-dependent enzyme